jgi:hypothetical protein
VEDVKELDGAALSENPVDASQGMLKGKTSLVDALMNDRKEEAQVDRKAE